MRHGFANKKLNRTSEHRKALLKNMLNSLVKYEQIKTTLPKAKFLKPQADKLITLGKNDTLHNTKMLVSQLQDIKSANKVKKTLSKRYEKRSGGYTRIIKAGFRYGDNAPMAIIEFVDRDVEAKRVDKKKKDPAKEVNKKEEHYITSLGETGSVLYPKTTRPIFTRIAPTKIKITPSPVDSTSCTVNYYKEPTTPSFGYVVVNEKALYNSNTSVDFELASSEEEQLVSRILLLSGTIIKQPDIAQTGAAFLQQKNQEQNS